MPLEVKQFNCPNCGSPLSLKNAARSRSVVCPACNSQIDLSAAGYRVMGNVGSRPAPRLTQFTVGMTGTLGGEQHEIIGRVLYRGRDEDYTWDEWLLLSAAGAYRWLSDDEDEGMVLWHGFTPSQPLDPNTVRDGQTINLNGVKARVSEVTRPIIDYLEGELTWKASKGDTISALDAAGPDDEMFSIEWTADEIEFYQGERQDQAAVAAAFGVPAAASAGAPLRHKVALSSLVWIVIVVLVCLFACVTAVGAGGTNCLATPAAVRSTSCTSSTFSHTSSGGGGFGGGGGSGK